LAATFFTGGKLKLSKLAHRANDALSTTKNYIWPFALRQRAKPPPWEKGKVLLKKKEIAIAQKGCAGVRGPPEKLRAGLGRSGKKNGKGMKGRPDEN